MNRRLARLSESVEHVLAAAALLGPDFELQVLVRVSGLAQERLVDALDEALVAGLLVETSDTVGRYSFRHSLIREALVDRLNSARRAHYDHQIVAGLEAHNPKLHLAELAHHLLAVAPRPGSAERARGYATSAAEQAAARFAHDEAARLLQIALTALDLEPDPPERERCDLLLAMGDAELRAGDSERARTVFADGVSSARLLGDPDRLARAALGTAGGRPRSGVGAAEDGSTAVFGGRARGLRGAIDNLLSIAWSPWSRWRGR